VTAVERPTIAVLGTMTRDTTVYADGSRSENLGGLLYSLTALAYLFAGRARIRAVANVGADLAPRLLAALQLPGLDTRYVRQVETPNNHVHLTYHDAQSRDEVLVGLVPPVDAEHALAAARGADHYLINMTSGRDIELAAFERLRAEFEGTIQFDLHSLTLDIAPGGRRVLRRPPDWRKWIACADWVQMNETEARLLVPERAPESALAEILALGPKAVCATLGRDGVCGAWRAAGNTYALRLPAATRPRPAYPTGCGDVFGAAFAYARLSGAGVAAALRAANGVAGVKAGFEPDSALRDIRTHAAADLDTWPTAG
jgi:sugar/nucleoside kinase (ribokinase family)